MDKNKNNIVKISEKQLREIVEKIFEKMGVPIKDCNQATDVLVSADLRGVESHGVSNMLRKYVRDYRNGKLNPVPKWRIIRESLSTASIDCDRGLGIIVAPKAMEIAIEKAKKTGVGVVTMDNVGHMGMLAYYAMQALKHDMIGMAMSSCPPIAVPTFGAEPRFGTNPIALAAPANIEIPFVYDAATTVVSSNKIGLIKRLGTKLPSGWIADNQGVPIMDEIDLDTYQKIDKTHPYLLPLGSIPEFSSHKGYGLSCVVEILSGVLASGGYSMRSGRSKYTHYVAAYDIEAFMDKSEFKNAMDEWLNILKNTKPAPGHDRVFYPGLIESELESKNRSEGIPLHQEVLDWFISICEELSIPCSFLKEDEL